MYKLCICISISCIFDGMKRRAYGQDVHNSRLPYQAHKRLCFQQYFKGGSVISGGSRGSEHTLFFLAHCSVQAWHNWKKATKSSQINLPSTDSSVTPSFHGAPSRPWYGHWSELQRCFHQFAMPPSAASPAPQRMSTESFFYRSWQQHQSAQSRSTQTLSQTEEQSPIKRKKNMKHPVATRLYGKVGIINNIRTQNRHVKRFNFVAHSTTGRHDGITDNSDSLKYIVQIKNKM